MSGMQRAVVLAGNPVDGFRVIGPYDSREEAIADGDIVDTEWWVADLEPPEADEPVEVPKDVYAPKHRAEF